MPTMTAWANTSESRGEMPTGGGEASIATSPSGAPARPAAKATPALRTATGEKVGRNDPCPCGSGKKYKKCCYLKQGGG